jgi:hypothetical protein
VIEVLGLTRRYGDVLAVDDLSFTVELGAAHPGRTGRQHLRMAASANGIPRPRVAEVIEQVGLRGAARRRIRGYSPGMRGIGLLLRSTAGVLGAAFLLLGEVPGMTGSSSVTVLLAWAAAAVALGGLRLVRDDANR